MADWAGKVTRFDPPDGLGTIKKGSSVTITAGKITIDGIEVELADATDTLVKKCTLDGKTHYLLQVGKAALSSLVMTGDVVEAAGLWAAEPGSASQEE